MKTDFPGISESPDVKAFVPKVSGQLNPKLKFKETLKEMNLFPINRLYIQDV